LVFCGVRQDGATPRQKEGEAKGEEEGGGREKELNEVVVSVHFELSFENIRVNRVRFEHSFFVLILFAVELPILAPRGRASQSSLDQSPHKNYG
jgi:hypothetical protein